MFHFSKLPAFSNLPAALAAAFVIGLMQPTPIVAETASVTDDFVTYTSDDSFADVTFAVENAIVSKGLVIDSVSHTGDMLERTKTDVGGTQTLFDGANVYQFCSAKVSRDVMEADTMNFRFCPYGIYVFQIHGTSEVTVGHHAYSGSMAPVQDLLTDIVKEALDLP